MFRKNKNKFICIDNKIEDLNLKLNSLEKSIWRLSIPGSFNKKIFLQQYKSISLRKSVGAILWLVHSINIDKDLENKIKSIEFKRADDLINLGFTFISVYEDGEQCWGIKE